MIQGNMKQTKENIKTTNKLGRVVELRNPLPPSLTVLNPFQDALGRAPRCPFIVGKLRSVGIFQILRKVTQCAEKSGTK